MITKVRYKLIFKISFIFLAWTFYACKESYHSNKGYIQKDINCYNEAFLTIVDTFGYHGNLIPPASSPIDNKKGIDNTSNKPDYIFRTSLIDEGKTPVIILNDSLINFAKINSVKEIGKPMMKDTTFNKGHL